MRTPILFKFFLCCTLLIVVALALPNPTRAAVATGAGLSDPITEALTPSAASEPISAPPADNNLQTLMTPDGPGRAGSRHPLVGSADQRACRCARTGTLCPAAAGHRHRGALADTPQALKRQSPSALTPSVTPFSHLRTGSLSRAATGADAMLDGFAAGIGLAASVISGALPMKSAFVLRRTSLAIGLALAAPALLAQTQAQPQTPDPPDYPAGSHRQASRAARDRTGRDTCVPRGLPSRSARRHPARCRRRAGRSQCAGRAAGTASAALVRHHLHQWRRDHLRRQAPAGAGRGGQGHQNHRGGQEQGHSGALEERGHRGGGSGRQDAGAGLCRCLGADVATGLVLGGGPAAVAAGGPGDGCKRPHPRPARLEQGRAGPAFWLDDRLSATTTAACASSARCRAAIWIRCPATSRCWSSTNRAARWWPTARPWSWPASPATASPRRAAASAAGRARRSRTACSRARPRRR
jgi:hypothetical protein